MTGHAQLASALAVAVAFGLGVLPAGASNRSPDKLLERYRPILRYDSEEGYFAQPISQPFGAPEVRPGNRVYGHRAREQGQLWLQYWLFYAYNPQDRGIFRTGRHEGDWELVQFRLGADRKPDLVTLAQHSWAEGCRWDELDLVKVGGHEVAVVYVANGSHATYSRPGVQDRPFPDPNDEADGLGGELRPRVVRIAGDTPAWVAWPGRWGRTRAGPIPGESSSPRGPRFAEGDAWSAPATFHEERARPCASGPPGRWWQTPAVLAAVGALVGCFLLYRRALANRTKLR